MDGLAESVHEHVRRLREVRLRVAAHARTTPVEDPEHHRLREMAFGEQHATRADVEVEMPQGMVLMAARIRGNLAIAARSWVWFPARLTWVALVPPLAGPGRHVFPAGPHARNASGFPRKAPQRRRRRPDRSARGQPPLAASLGLRVGVATTARFPRINKAANTWT